ncbi:uncharacterized protein LOC116418428 [Piliocolobus tephrosceles]|uniref:uncharacterized protein LOC116418428 n=1 Tax=Piliocolobus tephrosceles TaxID=591936 RepID=UPI0013018506|nr:uncharacterized protein LOC116418428 [Piliocolobus tephrosceles]
MARGEGGEESLGALLSPPPGGGARTALAGLTPQHPARLLFTAQALPGRRSLGAPPPPGPAGGWEGARRKGVLLSPPRRGPQRRLRLLLSLTPPPAPLYLRGTRAGGGGARTGPGDNCQLEAPLGGGGGRKGRSRERRGRALSPPTGKSCGEKQRKRPRRHPRCACVAEQFLPPPATIAPRPATQKEELRLSYRPRSLLGLRGPMM